MKKHKRLQARIAAVESIIPAATGIEPRYLWADIVDLGTVYDLEQAGKLEEAAALKRSVAFRAGRNGLAGIGMPRSELHRLAEK